MLHEQEKGNLFFSENDWQKQIALILMKPIQSCLPIQIDFLFNSACEFKPLTTVLEITWALTNNITHWHSIL
jgi:hypothetical protein